MSRNKASGRVRDGKQTGESAEYRLNKHDAPLLLAARTPTDLQGNNRQSVSCLCNSLLGRFNYETYGISWIKRRLL